ncbi:LysR family transcriptional regulator [Pseudooceanicola sp. CBS1P-1]|uniref:LysR family transcriptional regulator n=1 Tax=Pseudooceanicola albus TaxID=2692189 RepID=A0A6L7G6Z9_9RHOB|nr:MULTISPECIES: LysR family transcriptional regulator [Pseudooceanicola]MBT9383120.1 LysR family transcriptional regulator [Pseudooceanicola endophyticus]MXN19308.1 LysR family transcriptional regulator [Pseudooceanicola albus]
MTASPGRITLWGIEVFVAAAEERSISAAARRLGASPSAVSQQLTNLEAALGVSLLQRTARPLTLTPKGEAFRRRAQSILNEAAQARAELAVAGQPGFARLRLGMIEDFESEVTPPLLIRMADRFPDTRFLLETGASHFLADQLEAEALDLIVTAELAAPAPWAEVHPILSETFIVAAPRGAIRPGPHCLDALKRMPLVQYTTRHYMGRLIATHLAQQNLRLNHRFELDSYHAILELVRAGTGWTILPPLALIRTHRLAGALDLLPLPFAPLERRIVLTARAGILQDAPAGIAAELRALLIPLLRDAPDLPPLLRDTIRIPAP